MTKKHVHANWKHQIHDLRFILNENDHILKAFSCTHFASLYLFPYKREYNPFMVIVLENCCVVYARGVIVSREMIVTEEHLRGANSS